ncbi:MAG: hypothetical protein HY825_04525 [Acidobacteria bacterium]|nr:hypothetical protein [Acidobacteriota bacterium]
MHRRTVPFMIVALLLAFAGGVSAQTTVPDCWANQNDPACKCMDSVLPGYAGAGCTANDTRIVLVGLGVLDDGCVNGNDTVKIKLRVQVNAGGAERYDIGWFIPQDATGTGRELGLCQSGFLMPVGTPANPKSGVGPFRILESKAAEQDTCGDILATDNPTIFDYPSPVTLSCARVSAGFLAVPRCVVWSQGVGNLCSSIFQTGTNTAFNSKCNCDPGDTATDIPGPNVAMTCAFGTPPGGTLDPGETVTNTMSITNTPGCTTPVTTPPTAERYQCSTSAYLRFVATFTPGHGTVAATPPAGSGDEVFIDNATGVLVWVVKNPNPLFGSSLGIIGPFAGTHSLPYTYTKSDNFVGTISFAHKMYWSNSLPGDHADLIGAIEQICTDCSCATNITTTPVTLAGFQAHREGGRVDFEWTTATEVGTVGYSILAQTPSGWVPLTAEPIPSQAGDSVEPRDYRLSIEVPEGVESFVIEDMDAQGKVTRHPVVTTGDSQSPASGREPVAWGPIKAEHEAKVADREARLQDAHRAALRDHLARGAQGQGISVPPIEIKVTADGIYRVTYEDLLAAGFDLQGVQTQKIGLTNRGEDVPIYTSAGKLFGPGAYLEFIGKRLNTLYTRENVYRLVIDSPKAARVAVDQTQPPSVRPVATYLETRSFGQDRVYEYNSPTGDPWCHSLLGIFQSAREWDFPLTVDGLAANSGAVLGVHLFGDSALPASPDHRVVVKLNGEVLGEYLFDGVVDYPININLPAGLLREGANTLTLRLPGGLGTPIDVVCVEDYSVTYPRFLRASADALAFAGRGSRFEVGGLSSSNLVGYRVEGGMTTRLNSLLATPDAGAFKAVLPGTLREARHLVSTVGALPRACIAAGRVVGASDSKGEKAQYLIVAHPDFLDGLAGLVDAKQRQGLSVKVVDVEDIYAQYGYGMVDPAAIKAYIAWAADTLRTEYVLLVGGDTYDYHNVIGLGALSFIPSIYSATDQYIHFAPTDPSFVDLDGDGTPDLAIGRLPVRTSAELAEVIRKTLSYGWKTYGSTAVFAADALDPGANLPFKAVSDSFIPMLGAGWTTRRVYLDDMSLADARIALMDSINGGVALTGFIGHSGPTRWSFPYLFSTADVDALTNAGQPTVVAQWGCWNTYYLSGSYEGLGNKLLLSGDRGAAAILGATTITQDTSEAALGEVLFGVLTQPGMTLGKAVLAAKNELAATHKGLPDVLLGWTLLGDPALAIEP